MQKIGRYTIEAEIGRGTMGIVYLALDSRLRRRVAVKTYALPPGLPKNREREFRERFLREAQAAAALSHPGIVTVYDADEDPSTGVPFIAMEYVPGRSLRDWLESGDRIEPQKACALVEMLADALHTAHGAGVVHRDIKPANILVREGDGAVKIADFGVARLPSSNLTREGTTPGSPGYMSPEQITGGRLDGRSDLFALAVILYEMLAGRRPFDGDDLPSAAYAIVHSAPVPITRRRPDLPAGLERFFGRALAKDPAQRFCDGAAFREALVRARGEGLVTRSHTPDTAPDETLFDTDRLESIAAGLLHQAGRLWAPGRFARAAARIGLDARRARIAAVLLPVLLIWGWWLWAHRDAHLKLDARSSVRAGNLTLLVDGDIAYTRQLAASESGRIRKVFGWDQETFEAWIDVEPGKRELVARVATEDDPQEFRDTIVVDLQPGETRQLRIVAGRSFGRPLSLKID